MRNIFRLTGKTIRLIGQSANILLIVFLLLLLVSCAKKIVIPNPDLQSDTLLTIPEAQKYKDLLSFLDAYVASEYTFNEKIHKNYDELRKNGIYFYRAMIVKRNAKKQVQALMWPRNALKLFCESKDGIMLEDTFHKPNSFMRFANSPMEEASYEKAILGDAFGKKICVIEERISWSVYMSPGTISGIIPDHLQQGALGTEARIYTAEITIPISTLLYRREWGELLGEGDRLR